MMEKATEIFAAILAIFGLGEPEDPYYAGYIEGDYVYVASVVSGRLEEITVSEGDIIEAGTLLISIDDELAADALEIAKSRVEVARAQLENTLSGAREEEIAVVRAQLAMAQATYDQAKLDADRNRQLVESGVISQTVLDSNLTQLATAEAQIAQLNAQITSMELPARPAEQAQATANLNLANAELTRQLTEITHYQLTAPVNGMVERVYYDSGEVVQTGQPIISILPETGRVIRFYIPEDARAAARLGDRFRLECSGCPAGVEVELTYLDAQPQFTPPIIYSREERARLVYRAEGRPVTPLSLLPGQPVTLEPLP